jgi:prepilin-type N-terminal cleavage/methylation domain-containing protein
MKTQRHGWTVVEVMVALAIIALLGALVVPSIIASVDRARVKGAEDSLTALARGVGMFEDRVNAYPSRLTQLVFPIVAGTDTDICGTTYNVGQQNRWGGPYLDRTIPAAGVPIGIGTVVNQFDVLPDPSGIDYLRLVIGNVLLEDAAALDMRVDGGDGAGGGTIRWLAPAGGFVTAYYLIPFADC